MNGGRERTKARTTRFGVAAALGATLLVAVACADEGPLAPAAQTPVAAPQVAPSDAASQSPLRPIMKAAGLATDVDEPPDFVVQSRPAQAPASMPVFTAPAEPPGKIENAKGLEAVDADLAAAGKRQDALAGGLSALRQGGRGRKPPRKRPNRRTSRHRATRRRTARRRATRSPPL